MSSPDGTGEQPAVQPSVTTAPAPGRPHTWWAAIPAHLGRARTSTVVLALLFLAIGALYLTVRPDPVATATTGGSTATTPAQQTGGGTGPTSDPTTAAPTAPTTTDVPATTATSTPSDLPTTSTVPEETTASVPTTTDETTTEAPLPTTETPTG